MDDGGVILVLLVTALIFKAFLCYNKCLLELPLFVQGFGNLKTAMVLQPGVAGY